MAKRSTRLTVKGFLDADKGVIIEHDKDLGDIAHDVYDLLSKFSGLDNVVLTFSHDEIIEGEQQ